LYFRLAPDDGPRALYSRKRTLRLLAAALASLLIVCSARAVELFRYRYHAENGREFECVFETDEQSVPKTVGQEKAAEIAMDWMRVSYSIQVNTMESQEFRTRPVPHWFFCFSETSEGPIQRMYFVVLLPNGMIVEPKVSERL
jgi:hypothetical protein